MSADRPVRCRSLVGRVVAQRVLADSMRTVELEFPEPVDFLPGHFAMLNFTGGEQRVFSRPFSIMAVAGSRMTFLYRVVGEATGLMASLPEGRSMTVLGPLGSPFPAPGPLPVLLVAGGVGLPPLYAWWQRHARGGDAAIFGARRPAEVPFELLDSRWRVCVEEPGPGPDGNSLFTGLVTDLWRQRQSDLGTAPHQVFACGPLPMLRAVSLLARSLDWPCWVSVEEHMGCGYGVCRGCVVASTEASHLTACQDGPVLAAERIDWERFGHSADHGAPADDRGRAAGGGR